VHFLWFRRKIFFCKKNSKFTILLTFFAVAAVGGGRRRYGYDEWRRGMQLEAMRRYQHRLWEHSRDAALAAMDYDSRYHKAPGWSVYRAGEAGPSGAGRGSISTYICQRIPPTRCHMREKGKKGKKGKETGRKTTNER
jgi:hypothetical protein